MKIAYLDCFAGISGDMFVGACIDLGLDPQVLEAELRKLPVEGYRLETARVNKRGVQAVQFKVMLDSPQGEQLADSEYREVERPGSEHSAPGVYVQEGHSQAAHEGAQREHSHPHEHPEAEGEHTHPHAHETGKHEHGRSLPEILAILQSSTLSQGVRATARRIFERLAEAEGRVHGMPREQVHFHEVGGIDAIVDITSAAIALEQLGIEQVYASPVHLGSGFVRSQHGLYPVPAPATAQLLAGVPVYSSEVKGELVTPTGAAILTTVASSFGAMPLMRLQASGYGAGSREREFPNVLRIFLGEVPGKSQGAEPGSGAAAGPETASETRREPRQPFPEQHRAPPGPSGYHEGQSLVIETNIDDMNPQLFENLMDRLLQTGALDVLIIPVYMKKGRPGLLLQVLAQPASRDDLMRIIFAESTSIGVRTYPVTKHMLQRESFVVATAYGPVRVKAARLGERIVNLSPEYEDCRELARLFQVPLKEIYAAAAASAGNWAEGRRTE